MYIVYMYIYIVYILYIYMYICNIYIIYMQLYILHICIYAIYTYIYIKHIQSLTFKCPIPNISRGHKTKQARTKHKFVLCIMQ